MLDSKSQDWSNPVFGTMMYTMMWSFFIGLLVPGLQAFQWLKTGLWELASVRHVLEMMEMQLPLDRVSWIGIRQVVEWLLDVHVSFYLCGVIPGLIICVALSLKERMAV